jgi:homoserine kinase
MIPTSIPPLSLRLPATSANLGPGFDALGLAFDLWLEIDASVAPEFKIQATGRNADLVASLDRNLMLSTYQQAAPGAPPLRLVVRNQIPLGMGCGSSAAALLAGVLLANHFGRLGWTDEQIVAEACRREGHPDNVAACFHGGLTVSSMMGGTVTAASLGHQLRWRLLLVLPQESLATTTARALLPASYSRADVVLNLQATALLVAAFALDRPDFLAIATRDAVHQPFRGTLCPLLPALLPLAGQGGIYAVTLSGAGPSVLLLTEPAAPLEAITGLVRARVPDGFELVEARIAPGAQRDAEGTP